MSFYLDVETFLPQLLTILWGSSLLKFGHTQVKTGIEQWLEPVIAWTPGDGESSGSQVHELILDAHSHGTLILQSDTAVFISKFWVHSEGSYFTVIS